MFTIPTRRNNNVIIATSFWRNNDVIFQSRARWVSTAWFATRANIWGPLIRASSRCLDGVRTLIISLQWHNNKRHGVSNHRRYGCSLSRLFRRRSKKTSKLCVTGLCEGNSPATGEFPAQGASNAENDSIWWRQHLPQILLHFLERTCWYLSFKFHRIMKT